MSRVVWGRIEEVSERDEIDECDWMASASLAGKATDGKMVEVCDGCGTSSESLLSCTSSQFGPELERVIAPQVMKENVEDVRLVSSRHARKRQRKMASKLRLRVGGEDQSAVGSMERPEAVLEHSGLLEGSAANLEYPLLSGSGWDGTETNLKENVLELEADDLDEKIINDGVEVKRFKVRAWGGVHMSQSGQESPGEQCGDKDIDIGQIDDEERVVKDWRHTQRSNVKQRGETGVDAI